MGELVVTLVLFTAFLALIVVVCALNAGDVFSMLVEPCLRQPSSAIGLLLVVIACFVCFANIQLHPDEEYRFWLWRLALVLGLAGTLLIGWGIRTEMLLHPTPPPEGPPSTGGSSHRRLEQDVVITVKQTGIARTALQPCGKAEFNGKLCDVTTDGLFVEAGKPVEVIQATPLAITVRPVVTRLPAVDTPTTPPAE